MSFTNTVWSQCGLGIHPSPFTACGKQPFCRPLMVSGGKSARREFFSSLTSYFLSQKQQKKRMKRMRARTFCLCVFFLACGCSRSNESSSSCAIFIFRLSGAKPAQVVSHWGAMQCGPKQPRSEKFSSHFFAIKVFFWQIEVTRSNIRGLWMWRGPSSFIRWSFYRCRRRLIEISGGE